TRRPRGISVARCASRGPMRGFDGETVEPWKRKTAQLRHLAYGHRRRPRCAGTNEKKDKVRPGFAPTKLGPRQSRPCELGSEHRLAFSTRMEAGAPPLYAASGTEPACLGIIRRIESPAASSRGGAASSNRGTS